MSKIPVVLIERNFDPTSAPDARGWTARAGDPKGDPLQHIPYLRLEFHEVRGYLVTANLREYQVYECDDCGTLLHSRENRRPLKKHAKWHWTARLHEHGRFDLAALLTVEDS